MKNTNFFGLIAGATLGLSACSTTAPSHIPNPVTLPIAAAGTALENVTYGAKRRNVSQFVTANHRYLIDEIALGGGPTLAEAMNLAEIELETRPGLIQRLSKDLHLYADAEPLVVALMVHGN